MIRDLYTFLFIQLEFPHNLQLRHTQKKTQIKYALLKRNKMFYLELYNELIFCYRMINCFEVCNGVFRWLNYMQAYEETHKLICY